MGKFWPPAAGGELMVAYTHTHTHTHTRVRAYVSMQQRFFSAELNMETNSFC